MQHEETIDTRIRLDEVERQVGLKKSAIYKRIDRGEFPAPVRDGGASRWLQSHISAYVRGSWSAIRDMGTNMGEQHPA